MALKNIDTQTAKQWLENDEAVLIDVREPAEYSSQRINGAKLLPLTSLKRPKKLETNKKALVYCRSGRRSLEACQKLAAANDGVDFYNLQGGIEAWRNQGLPVEESDRKILPLDRQVQLTIGLSLLVFGLLGYFAHPAFSLGAAFFGAGLSNAGLTGWCGLAKLIARMPWNQKQ
ncbi:MAG: rhodanese-like domain-containing protein [Alphaproteobacteria bacterium]